MLDIGAALACAVRAVRALVLVCAARRWLCSTRSCVEGTQLEEVGCLYGRDCNALNRARRVLATRAAYG